MIWVTIFHWPKTNPIVLSWGLTCSTWFINEWDQVESIMNLSWAWFNPTYSTSISWPDSKILGFRLPISTRLIIGWDLAWAHIWGVLPNPKSQTQSISHPKLLDLFTFFFQIIQHNCYTANGGCPTNPSRLKMSKTTGGATFKLYLFHSVLSLQMGESKKTAHHYFTFHFTLSIQTCQSKKLSHYSLSLYERNFILDPNMKNTSPIWM